jgi:proteic killer suppression protein
MIRSCRDTHTQLVLDRLPSRKFQAIQYKAEERLALLHAATSLLDLSLPSLRLEKLSGDRKGRHSIRINDQYRVCFNWRGGDAFEVEIVDYH